MAANNLIVRKGKCINLGNDCKIANSKEIVEINLGDEFVCPECGGMLVEVNKPNPFKKVLIPVSIILVAVIIIGGGYAYFNFQKTKVKSAVSTGKEGITEPDSVPKDPKAETLIKLINQADLLFASKEYSRAKDLYNSILAIDSNNRNAIQKLQEIAKITGPPQGPHGPVIVEHATVKYDYGYYEGPTKDGLAHGTNGIMYFQQRHIINPRDPEKRYAEAGEYVSGIFHNGFLVNGKYFGKDNQQKGAINIGR